MKAYKESLDLTKRFTKPASIRTNRWRKPKLNWKHQAQDTNIGILRAQYEHAIAMLVGQPASSFSIASNR